MRGVLGALAGGVDWNPSGRAEAAGLAFPVVAGCSHDDFCPQGIAAAASPRRNAPGEELVGTAPTDRSAMPSSNRPPRSGVHVKIGAVHGPRDEAGADHKTAKSFPGIALSRIGGEERVEFGDYAGVVEVVGIELREP
jgi:hypothetical protein